ncbi:hypothetical protein ACHAXR_003394, partial [Thalassiosira sp. AJA248-18]
SEVPFDAAGALWQCAAAHAPDFLRGNHDPALAEWTVLLNYLRSVCNWRLVVYMDGMDNHHKQPENERRRQKARKAREKNDLRGQIKNTPEYINKAVEVCKFLNIRVQVSTDEADPQVTYHALAKSVIAVTGDSDLLAYGPPETPSEGGGDQHRMGKLMIIKKYSSDNYRMIDLECPVEEGKYPLFDLYQKHGRIVFQLYAGCSGCDFTQQENGIVGIGKDRFIPLLQEMDCIPTADGLAAGIWRYHSEIATKAGFGSEDEVKEHLQHIVNIFTQGRIYDAKSNIINFSGEVLDQTTQQSKLHMTGEVNSRTGEAFSTPRIFAKASTESTSLNIPGK